MRDSVEGEGEMEVDGEGGSGGVANFVPKQPGLIHV